MVQERIKVEVRTTKCKKIRLEVVRMLQSAKLVLHTGIIRYLYLEHKEKNS